MKRLKKKLKKSLTEGVSKKSTPFQISLSGHNTASSYHGSKWGIFLRAPRIYFVLKQRCGAKLVPLATLADVSFGLKSGCDKFFFPRDITDRVMSKYSDSELKQRYGFISKDATKKIRLLRAGDGSVHLLEAQLVEPEIHGLMEIEQISIDQSKLRRRVVMIPTKLPKKYKYARKYVHWGETEGFHTGETCRSRVTKDRNWYDLTGRARGKIIWPKLQQYRHVVAHNPKELTCNCNLYDVFPKDGIDDRALCAVLNSTIVAMMKFLYGSQMGREANQVTEIFDAKMMLVPDIRHLPSAMTDKLASVLEKLKTRETQQLLDVDSDASGWTGELADPVRQRLDDLTLMVLGITDENERVQLRNELYLNITELYRRMRTAEKKMQRYRSLGALGGRITAQSIAGEIWDHLPDKPEHKGLAQFPVVSGNGIVVDLPPGTARISKATLFQRDVIQVGTVSFEFNHPIHCEFVKRLVDAGVIGRVKVPEDPAACQGAIDKFDKHNEQLRQEFLQLAGAYTADDHLQTRVVQELWKKMVASSRSQEPTDTNNYPESPSPAPTT